MTPPRNAWPSWSRVSVAFQSQSILSRSPKRFYPAENNQASNAQATQNRAPFSRAATPTQHSSTFSALPNRNLTAGRYAGADQCAIHHKGGVAGSDQPEGIRDGNGGGGRRHADGRRVRAVTKGTARCEVRMPLVEHAEGKTTPAGALPFTAPKRAPGPPGDMKPPLPAEAPPRRASRTATATDKGAARSPLPDHPGEAEGAASARCSCGHVSDRATRGTSDATQQRRCTQRGEPWALVRGASQRLFQEPAAWRRAPVRRS